MVESYSKVKGVWKTDGQMYTVKLHSLIFLEKQTKPETIKESYLKYGLAVRDGININSCETGICKNKYITNIFSSFL